MKDVVGDRWSAARCAGFRFAFLYVVLLYLPPFGLVLDQIVPWVGAHVFGIEDIASHSDGTASGDRLFDWVHSFCRLVVALLGAAVWCIVARRGALDERLRAGLRVGMRYVLAFTMLQYGFFKLSLLQFPAPDTTRLLQTYGESSPMGLLWTFMGYSPAYVIFGGFAEVLGGALLLSRRTTMLGALVVVGVMSNVVMLNLCYDVPMKIMSTHLLLLALLIVVPDARRLADVFLFHRPPAQVALRRPFSTERRRRAWVVAKGLVVALIFAITAGQSYVMWRMTNDDAGRRATTYEVEVFAKDGAVIPPLEGDPVRWRRLEVTPDDGISVVLMDGTTRRYATEPDDRAEAFTLTVIDGDHAVLAGTFDGAALELHLRRIDDREFTLTSRGFHWVNEGSFVR